jgi:two-component system response regulator AtoC
VKTHENTPCILVADDEREVLGYFEMALKCLGYRVETAQDGDEALACLRSSGREVAAVLLDLVMPNRDGMETLREIRSFDPSIPVMVVSGAASPNTVVSAMKNGANDFLCKPVGHEELRRTLAAAIQAKESPSSASVRLSKRTQGDFIGTSPRIKEIQAVVAQIGWSEAPVLIQGETGTGKEVLARELHARSPRADKPFLKLNCAALPTELVESELFGYERGAFTGAMQKKAGMFEMADGGTILLDEIGDMDVRLQAKLLHVLQDQEFRRIGGRETIKVDVRVMAATHHNLEAGIDQKTFRGDLYYRLSVVKLYVPALRERKEDILPLTEFLLRRHAAKGMPMPRVDTTLRQALTSYHWPGNIRELENFVRKLTILRDGDAIARELSSRSKAIPLALDHVSTETGDAARPLAPAPILQQVGEAKRQAETTAILAALESTHWNRKRAASALKIDYKAMLYKMKKLGIDDQIERKPSTLDTSPRPAAKVVGSSGK